MFRRLGFIVSIMVATLFFQAGFSQERLIATLRTILHRLI